MRLECQFGNCNCKKHIGHQDDICGICGHGGCWHKIDYSQFYSPRASARRGIYYIEPIIQIFVPIMPEVPPFPEDSPRFCNQIKKLPV